MQGAKPSRTAMRVAIRRAAHQVMDKPIIFDDPLALRVIGTEEASKVTSGLGEHSGIASRSLRAFLVARNRFAEDELATAIQDGVRQYVLLGAGLDTFAYRNPHSGSGLRVFEVDFLATQEWKREQLRSAGITIPAEVVYVPVDFERETLVEGLRRAGFDGNEKTFFSWLGVSPYLTEKAFGETLEFIASMPSRSGVVFDYAVPRSTLGFVERFVFDRISARVAAAGEPFRLFISPNDLAERLRRLGFTHLEDLGVQEINSRYFSGRADGLRVRGGLGRLMSARR